MEICITTPPSSSNFSGFSKCIIKRRSFSCRCVGAGRTDEPEWASQPSAPPHRILGVDPVHCSASELKSAFRARVKEFHPDVYKDTNKADLLIRRIIEAYEILSANKEGATGKSTTCRDPFEDPECEACDIFVNETQCMGKGCPYSCVKKAPHAFSFNTETGTARATSQGHGYDYNVQLAVGQCPRRCIYYVTSSQRVILEDLLQNVIMDPYNMGDAALLESLIITANYENNRYRGPKSMSDWA
ncbi:hypothetical protein LUZ60_003712 [Juncus effusus]|nr:hypothetical protein LUZ60_003712 [Juncus effusus]